MVRLTMVFTAPLILIPSPYPIPHDPKHTQRTPSIPSPHPPPWSENRIKAQARPFQMRITCPRKNTHVPVNIVDYHFLCRWMLRLLCLIGGREVGDVARGILVTAALSCHYGCFSLLPLFHHRPFSPPEPPGHSLHCEADTTSTVPHYLAWGARDRDKVG